MSDAQRVIRIASAIADNLGLTSPVDAQMVASYQGIRRVDVVPSAWAGCLIPGAELTVQLRQGDSPRRRRFTLLHEVAHTFMPDFQLELQFRCNPLIGSRGRRDPVEQLCDIAASELLLPQALLSADLADSTLDLDLIDDLANRYDASLEATAHRVLQLWPEDALFLVLEQSGKPSAPDDVALRVTAAHPSGRWPFIPRHKSVGDSHPLNAALQGEIVEEQATLIDLNREIASPVNLSARLYPYYDHEGRQHMRVLAIATRPKLTQTVPA